MGGAVKAIETRFYQQEISTSAYKYQLAIEKKEKLVIGVNAFEGDHEPEPDTLKIDESVAQRQLTRLKKIRSERDNPKVNNALDTLKASARSKENLIPNILKCVEAYGTVGEISDTLREVWGEYQE
jgi:methylmalonyl-CoA mutase N-terminal domain/subunit